MSLHQRINIIFLWNFRVLAPGMRFIAHRIIAGKKEILKSDGCNDVP